MLGAMNQMNYLGQPQGNYWQVGTTYTSSTNSPSAVDTDSSNNVFVVNYDAAAFTRAAISKYNSSGTGQWTKVLGDGSSVTLIFDDVVTDSSGNAYASGYIDSADGLIVKYDSTGAITWQKKWNISGTVTEQGFGIALSANGNIIIGGVVDSDVYAIAINSSGTTQWATKIVAASLQQTPDVTTDSSNNVYILARNLDSDDSALILKFNSTGTLQWQQTLTDTGTTGEFIGGIDTDSSGNVYVNMTKPSYAYIAKYNTSGTLQWQRSLTYGANAGITDIIVDPTSGNIYAVGFVIVSTLTRGFVFCYNSSGTIQWQRSLSASSSLNVDFSDIALASNGDLVITGAVSGYAGPVTWRLPNTGGALGPWTWNSTTFTWATTSYTDAAGDLEQATPTYTSSSATATTTDTTYTSTNRTMTNTLTAITS